MFASSLVITSSIGSTPPVALRYELENGEWMMEDRENWRMENRRSRIAPQPSIFYPQSSILNLLSSIFYPQSSILNLPSSIFHPQSSILNLPSSIFHPQSSILHRHLLPPGDTIVTGPLMVDRRMTGVDSPN